MTPGPKAWALLEKLQALADRGIDGEREAAARKLARLRARFDFDGAAKAKQESDETDLFKGNFQRSRSGAAVSVLKFGRDYQVANAVKWAIENAAGIPCQWRDGELLAEATPLTARKLTDTALVISNAIRELWGRFSLLAGINPADREIFIMGLYDGMMGEARQPGQRLPSRAKAEKIKNPKKREVAAPTGLHIHPYTAALDYGRQIRFSVPVEKIAGEINELKRSELAA